jgi:hypothetical protein
MSQAKEKKKFLMNSKTAKKIFLLRLINIPILLKNKLRIKAISMYLNSKINKKKQKFLTYEFY